MAALQPKSRLDGFTVVELLIVVVVIAILAAITIISYKGIQASAVISMMKNDLSQAVSQLETDKALNGSYPVDAAAAGQGKGLRASGGGVLSYTLVGSGFCLVSVTWLLLSTILP